MVVVSRPLQVVHLCSADLWAGAEVATFHLLRALAERDDVEVRAVLLNPGELERRLVEVGVRVDVEPEAGRGFRALAVAVRARVAGAELVHSHRYKENLLALISRRPWVATQHGRPEPERGFAAWRGGLYRTLDRAVQRRARRVIAVSSEVEEWLRPRLGARVSRIWNGIADPTRGLELPSWGTRPWRVGALGRLVPVKAFELAVESVAATPALELEIVGEGPERERLEACIAASGAGDRIRLLGHIPDPRALVASWRLMLVTSLHEGNPIGVMESLALGTPVLSADLRGVAEILDGQGGWTLPSRDPLAWAGRLAALLGDEEQAALASRAARRRYEQACTAAAAAARVRALYAEALSGPA